MAIAKVADIDYVGLDVAVDGYGTLYVPHPALSAGDLIILFGFGYAIDDCTAIYGTDSTTGITWIDNPTDPNIPGHINLYSPSYWWGDINNIATGTVNDNISSSVFIGKVNTAKASGSIGIFLLSLSLAYGGPIGPYVGGTIGGVVLSGASSTPRGATYISTSSTTNNLTTTAVTTTANNSWVFTAGYTPASTNSTSSDLTVLTRNLTYGQLLGYKTVATSGTSVTSNLDAPGTANATWTYETFEIKAATTPTLIAYGPSIRR